MDELIKALSEISPLSSFLEKRLGFSKEVSASLSTIIFIIICYGIYFLFKKLWARHLTIKKALEDVKPQFDYLSIKKARQFYIHTQYQNASPTRQEEPRFTHQYIARNKLIPFFLKIAFNEKLESERFYLILADSGMGKTTFMVNLYYSYHSFFNTKTTYDLKLFRFSNPSTIEHIKSIKYADAKNTILLLDALDEDVGIVSKDIKVSDVEVFRMRVNEIIEITRSFREVIITCRTQYFPNQEDNPYELELKRPDEKGFYVLNKLYISPFTDEDVQTYLRKKFVKFLLYNRKKRKRANEVVLGSRHLIMRPMLLSYIDYLIEDNITYKTSYQLYEVLVQKWLVREAEKRKIHAERESFIDNLYNFSENIAVTIFLNWKSSGYMHITKEKAVAFAIEHHIQLRPEEITGQSLLTCDGLLNWKFAHKSILEFFLAKHAYHNIKFLRYLNTPGMDMAKSFYEELNPRLILIENEKNFAYTQFKYTLIFKKINKFYIYKDYVQIEDFKEFIGLEFKGLINEISGEDVVRCTIRDAILFCNQKNIYYGYTKVYDDDFNFLNKNGIKTNDLNEVFGFRLPTEFEIKKCIITSHENRSLEYQTGLTNSKLKQVKKTEKEKVEYIKLDPIFCCLNMPEWSYDVNRFTFINLEEKIKNPNIPNQRGYENTTFESIGNLNFVIREKMVNSKEASEFLVPFRLVLNP